MQKLSLFTLTLLLIIAPKAHGQAPFPIIDSININPSVLVHGDMYIDHLKI